MRLLIFLLAIQIQAHAQDHNIKIALNWKAEAEFGGIYSAEVNHFFKKHHLNVEIIQGGAGTPSVQMVAAGKFDFGIASGDEIVIAQSHGAKVVALFATYQTNAQGIMTHEEQGFHNLEEVFASTNTLALQKGLPYAVYLQQKYKNLKATIVPFLGGISNFLADQNYSQQCFVTSEPISAEKKKQKVKTFLVADAGYNPYTTVLITREEVYKRDESVVKDLVSAIREGLAAYLVNPEETNIFMNHLNPSMDLETLKKSAAVQKALVETPDTAKFGIGSMTVARWEELSTQLFDLKLITKKLSSDQLFHNL